MIGIRFKELGDKPLVSVVIPTRNSMETMERCMESIRAQIYPNIEILVVDSCSRDHTREIAEKFGAKVTESKVGRSRARNIGMEKAAGEWILFLDSDMELTHSVIEECVRAVTTGYDAVIIPEISVGIGFWAGCKALEKLCYIEDEIIEAARFFRRSTFKAVNGYDEKLEAGEDWDLTQRIRKSGCMVGRVCVFIKHNEGRLTLWKAIKKKYEYGKTLALYRTKNPVEAKQQFTIFRPAFARNWRNLAKDPAHALGLVLMKTCELCAIELGHLKGKQKEM